MIAKSCYCSWIVENYQPMKLDAFIHLDISFPSFPLLCMLLPPQSSLGCMTLSWRRTLVLRTFPKNPTEETSRGWKALTRVPPRVRMANSSLFSPPSQFFNRSSGVQTIQTKAKSICSGGNLKKINLEKFYYFWQGYANGMPAISYSRKTWGISKIFQGLICLQSLSLFRFESNSK